jgi:hypothetical protein
MTNVTLIRKDGKRHNLIRGDLIPRGVRVVMSDGRVFVRKGWWGRTYVEGHSTHEYRPWH